MPSWPMSHPRQRVSSDPFVTLKLRAAGRLAAKPPTGSALEHTLPLEVATVDDRPSWEVAIESPYDVNVDGDLFVREVPAALWEAISGDRDGAGDTYECVVSRHWREAGHRWGFGCCRDAADRASRAAEGLGPT